MTASVSYLDSAVTVALDLEQELSDRMAGPVFQDEYTRLLLDMEPDAEKQARMSKIEAVQDDIQNRFLEVWSAVAAEMAKKYEIELFINLGGAEDSGATAAHIRDTVNACVEVTYTDGAWIVTRTDTPPVRL